MYGSRGTGDSSEFLFYEWLWKVHAGNWQHSLHGRPALAEDVQPEDPAARSFDAKWAERIDLTRELRFLSGNELAALFGFHDFLFPSDTTLKQQWKLVGNSLNVQVTSKVVALGLKLLAETSSDDKQS